MLCMLLAMADTPEKKRKIEHLYETYNQLMYTVAYNILHHVQDSEDALLASWEKVIRHLDKISEKPCPKTKSFLVIVTERTAIDLLRKKKRRKEIVLEEEDSPYYATKDKNLENVEVSDWINELPKIYAEVLLLYYVNELSRNDISELLKLPLSTVDTRLRRGKEMLKIGYDKQNKKNARHSEG